MLKKNLSESDWFILIANLLPAYGVIFLDWSPWEIFAIYSLETIIIGFFTIAKLGIATVLKKYDWWYNRGSKTKMHGTFFIFFFILHYGLFVTVQLHLFFSFSQMNDSTQIGVFEFLFNLQKYLSVDAGVLLSMFVLSHGYRILIPFILNRPQDISMTFIMFQPYGRIFIQQFTVILGSVFIGLGAGKIFIVIFTFIKIYFSVFLNYDAIMEKMDQKNKGKET